MQREAHVCSKCGWSFTNPHPSAKKRRAHKKVCGNLCIQGFKNNTHVDSDQTHQPESNKVLEVDDNVRVGGGIVRQVSGRSEDVEFKDASSADFGDNGGGGSSKVGGVRVVGVDVEPGVKATEVDGTIVSSSSPTHSHPIQTHALEGVEERMQADSHQDHGSNSTMHSMMEPVSDSAGGSLVTGINKANGLYAEPAANFDPENTQVIEKFADSRQVMDIDGNGDESVSTFEASDDITTIESLEIDVKLQMLEGCAGGEVLLDFSDSSTDRITNSGPTEGLLDANGFEALADDTTSGMKLLQTDAKQIVSPFEPQELQYSYRENEILPETHLAVESGEDTKASPTKSLNLKATDTFSAETRHEDADITLSCIGKPIEESYTKTTSVDSQGSVCVAEYENRTRETECRIGSGADIHGSGLINMIDLSDKHIFQNEIIQEGSDELEFSENVDFPSSKKTEVEYESVDTNKCAAESSHEETSNQDGEVGVIRNSAENPPANEVMSSAVCMESCALTSGGAEDNSSKGVSGHSSDVQLLLLQEKPGHNIVKQQSDASVVALDGSIDSISQTDSVVGISGSVSDGIIQEAKEDDEDLSFREIKRWRKKHGTTLVAIKGIRTIILGADGLETEEDEVLEEEEEDEEEEDEEEEDEDEEDEEEEDEEEEDEDEEDEEEQDENEEDEEEEDEEEKDEEDEEEEDEEEKDENEEDEEEEDEEEKDENEEDEEEQDEEEKDENEEDEEEKDEKIQKIFKIKDGVWVACNGNAYDAINVVYRLRMETEKRLSQGGPVTYDSIVDGLNDLVVKMEKMDKKMRRENFGFIFVGFKEDGNAEIAICDRKAKGKRFSGMTIDKDATSYALVCGSIEGQERGLSVLDEYYRQECEGNSEVDWRDRHVAIAYKAIGKSAGDGGKDESGDSSGTGGFATVVTISSSGQENLLDEKLSMEECQNISIPDPEPEPKKKKRKMGGK